MSDDLKKILEENGLTIDAQHWSSELGGAWTKYYVEFSDMTREEAYNAALNLGEVLRQAGEDNADLLDDPYYELVQSYLSYVTKDLIDEDELNSAKENADYYEKLSAMYSSSFGDMYNSFVDARDEYLETLQTGEGVEEAKTNFDTIYGNFKNSSKAKSDEIVNAFDDVKNSIDSELVKLHDWEDSLNNSNVLDVLSKLNVTDDQLRGINWEDEFTSEAEEAFGNLLTYLGVSSNEIEQVISLLVKMGAVIGEVQGSTLDNETTIFSLSESQSDAIDDFQTKVKTLGEALSSLQSGESITEMTDLLQEFPALATESGNLEEAIKQLIYESLNTLYATLGQDTPSTLKESLQSIADEASGISMPLDKALSNIQKTDTALRDFKKAMSKDGLTDDILNTVAGLSTSLNDLVAGFYAGTVSADELFTALTNHYNTDLKNYGNALIEKNKFSEDFYNAVGLNSAKLVNSLKENYSVDISNCKNYNEAKLQIESQTLRQISAMWSKYYNAQSRALTVEGEELAKKALLDGDPNSRRLLDKIMSQTKAYESAMDELNNIAYQGIGANFSGVSSAVYNNSNSGSKSDSDKETEEIFDFIETKINRLTDFYDDLKTKADDTFSSMTARALQYGKAIAKNASLIDVQNQAYNMYIGKANSIGLDEVWASQVRDGNFNIATVADEGLKDKINDYQEWYEKALECKKAISELLTEQKELNQGKIQLDIDVKTNELDELESKADKIQSKIDNDKKKKHRWTFRQIINELCKPDC